MSNTNLNTTGIKRDDYKAIKRMDRMQLSEYLSRVWKRGYKAGQETAVKINTAISTDKGGVKK